MWLSHVSLVGFSELINFWPTNCKLNKSSSSPNIICCHFPSIHPTVSSICDSYQMIKSSCTETLWAHPILNVTHYKSIAITLINPHPQKIKNKLINKLLTFCQNVNLSYHARVFMNNSCRNSYLILFHNDVFF